MLNDKYEDDWQSFLGDFISYLNSTEDSSWCTDVVRSRDGTGNCLYGHLSNFCGHKGDENVSPDFDWFDSLVSTSYVIYPINDGENEKYQQETPKKRCIAYLEALLSGEELTTIPGMAKCYEEFKAKNPEYF
ncbi:hypothetical protein [Rosenbergiella epipactidis]|uniref:hypothetical protein n=1 Tax=Rosenbergiella epipactidis TaxID=1544694 RepID=UPI001F4F7319|nr:hypothetical protein [Rosenbergiella epipactidis]